MIKGVTASWEITRYDYGSSEGMRALSSIQGYQFSTSMCRRCHTRQDDPSRPSVLYATYDTHLAVDPPGIAGRGAETDVAICIVCDKRIGISIEHQFSTLSYTQTHHYISNSNWPPIGRKRYQPIVPQFGDIGPVS